MSKLSFIKVPTHLWVTASAWGSRFITAGVQLVSIRYFLQALGTDSYSVFALLSALASWAILADLGIGYSLQNHISERRASGRDHFALIATAALLGIPLLVVAVGFLYLFAPWLSGFYLKVAPFLSAAEKSVVFGTAAIVFISTTLGGIAYKVWYANQRGWLANILPAVGSILGLLNILIFDITRFEFPLLAAILLFYAPSALLAMGALYWTWRQSSRKFHLRGSGLRIGLLLKRGWGFWVFAILSVIVLQADYLVISQVLAASNIVLYSLLQKLFGLAFFLYSALLQALWPVCAELRARKKWMELKHLVNRYLGFGVFGMCLFTGLFLVFRNRIFHLMSAELDVPITTVVLFGLYFIIRVWTDTYAMLLLSMNLLKPLWLMVPAQAVLSVGLQWFLAIHYGINGMLVGLILSFILTVAAGIPFVFYSNLRRMGDV